MMPATASARAVRGYFYDEECSSTPSMTQV